MPASTPRSSAARNILNHGGATGVVIATLVVLAVAAAAVWFLGDIPNRYRASEAMKAGRLALLDSHQAQALEAFRTAARFRPTDEAILRQYDQAQRDWVDSLERKTSGLDSTRAYLALHETTAPDAQLVEPHLGHFRTLARKVDDAALATATELLAKARQHTEADEFDAADGDLKALEPLRDLAPEWAAQREATRVARVNAAIAAASSAMDGGQFDEARATLKQAAPFTTKDDQKYVTVGQEIEQADAKAALAAAHAAIKKEDFSAATTHLDHATKLNVLLDDVASARTTLRERARNSGAAQLAQAIAKNDRKAAAAALKAGQDYAGWPAVDVESLWKPKDLASFLEALDTFGLGPKSLGDKIYRADVSLVLMCRDRFEAPAVETFLQDAFIHWSDVARGTHAPGLAVMLHDEARAHGAPVDNDRRKQLVDEARTSAHVAVALGESPDDNEAPKGFNKSATAAVRKALEAKLTTWPKMAPFDLKQPVTVMLQGGYLAFDVSDDTSNITRKTVRYQSGTQQVPNPADRELMQDYEDLVQRRKAYANSIAEKQAFIDSAGPSPDDFTKSQIRDKVIDITFDRAQLQEINGKIMELKRRAQSTPRYVDEPVYADEAYSVVHHVYTCSVAWVLGASLHGEIVTAAQWEAKTQFKSDEVVGNTAHNVPVHSPARVPEEKLEPSLNKTLLTRVSNVDDLVARLPDLTVASFASFHRNSDPLWRADQFLSLLYAWEAEGQILSPKKDILNQARALLSLPTA